MDSQDLLNELLQQYSTKNIAEKLNLAPGTVARWVTLKKVPSAYYFDLMRLANKPIDYTKFTSKDKDQFFTPIATAQYCYNIFLQTLLVYGDNEADYFYIEPSAGNGNFLGVFPPDRRVGLDIEPRNDEIIQADYLSWKPKSSKLESVGTPTKNVVFGNPPFGLRGHLALKFINHSYEFADYVCFILPQLFESDGKGVPRKRVQGYNLIHSEKLDTDFEEPTDDDTRGVKQVKVECIFQIWSKHHKNDDYVILDNKSDVMKIYSLSDGGTPSTTRNIKMAYKCDIYIPSTCFGKENMKYYESFDELPHKKGYGIVFNENKDENIDKFKRVKWCDVAFLSTNSAYNIRTSQILKLFT